MPNLIDLAGQTFGDLRVIGRAANNGDGHSMWNVECSCGAVKPINGRSLRILSTVTCGSGIHRRDNLIGRKFGLLTVRESLGVNRQFGRSGNGQVVKAECDCGGYWTGPADSLRKGNTKSCGCLPSGPRAGIDREAPVVRRVLGRYKRHAAEKELAWALSDDEFISLIKANCYYCNCPPSNERRDKAKALLLYNGIDRKNNAEGYIPSNVVTCCRPCNLAKREASVAEFLALVKRIYLHRIEVSQ